MICLDKKGTYYKKFDKLDFIKTSHMKDIVKEIKRQEEKICTICISDTGFTFIIYKGLVQSNGKIYF